MRMTRSIIRRLLHSAALLALLSGAAAAQGFPMTMPLQQDKPPPTQDEVDRQRALDSAYKSATSKIPDKKAADPWAAVRPSAGTPAAKKQPQ